MRPPRAIPLLLSVALALPAGAQIKATAGADAAAGGTGQVGSSLHSKGTTPTSLSLPPSTLAETQRPAAVSENPPAAQAAVSPEPLAAPVDPPDNPPHFIQALAALGVPATLTERLQSFLTMRHPGDQSRIYHRLKHSQEVADLTARIVSGQTLPAERKILLILSAALHDVDPERTPNTPARVSATITYLNSDDAARGLLVDFGSRYGFTAAQVKALIMATDFAVDTVQMRQIQETFAKAAQEAFPSETDWALTWGERLAFADQSATYVGSLAEARKRVEGFATELRNQLTAIGKGPGPSNADMLAGTYKFLNVLKRNPLFSLLPPEQSQNFNAVYAYFEARQTPAAWTAESAPAPARAPPRIDPDAARRYINGIMGSRAPTDREADALLSDWLDQEGIPRQSQRAREVRAALLPAKAEADAATASHLNSALRRHAALLIRIADKRRVTAPYIESVIVRRGLLSHLGLIPDASLEKQIEIALDKDELERAVASYPDNEQGRLMRSIASAMSARSGSSVEEVAREGVFVYADFSGSRLQRAKVGRRPDDRSTAVVFYVTRIGGQWRFNGYRQNRPTGLPDENLINGLKAWLRAGGISSSDFL